MEHPAQKWRGVYQNGAECRSGRLPAIVKAGSAAHILLMRLGVLLSTLLICGSANAGIKDPTWNPPARFDFPYKGELTIRRLPQAEVVKACRALFAEYKIKAAAYPNQHGCSAITSKNSCLIVTVDKTFMGATPESVLRHEQGHCNGWPADHPN